MRIFRQRSASASVLGLAGSRQYLLVLLVHGGGVVIEVFESYFGGVLFGVIDVLPVVPVARLDVLSLDSYDAGPGCTTTCGLRELLSVNGFLYGVLTRFLEMKRCGQPCSLTSCC